MDTLFIDQSLASLFERLRDHWIGCDWPTEFGPLRLNLQSITANQAALMVRATGRRESLEWREAAAFLAQIEADAKAARRAAALARDHAAAGQFHAALAHAERACEIERRYHAQPGWGPLVTAIRHQLDGENRSIEVARTAAIA